MNQCNNTFKTQIKPIYIITWHFTYLYSLSQIRNLWLSVAFYYRFLPFFALRRPCLFCKLQVWKSIHGFSKSVLIIPKRLIHLLLDHIVNSRIIANRQSTRTLLKSIVPDKKVVGLEAILACRTLTLTLTLTHRTTKTFYQKRLKWSIYSVLPQNKFFSLNFC